VLQDVDTQVVPSSGAEPRHHTTRPEQVFATVGAYIERCIE
jgi:hypothetical protein